MTYISTSACVTTHPGGVLLNLKPLPSATSPSPSKTFELLALFVRINILKVAVLMTHFQVDVIKDVGHHAPAGPRSALPRMGYTDGGSRVNVAHWTNCGSLLFSAMEQW